MRKTITAQEYAALRPYEANMKTALASDWTRGLGRTGIQVMKEIRDAVVGRRIYVNASCPVCVIQLVREVGRLYFAYQEAVEKKPVVKLGVAGFENVVLHRGNAPAPEAPAAPETPETDAVEEVAAVQDESPAPYAEPTPVTETPVEEEAAPVEESPAPDADPVPVEEPAPAVEPETVEEAAPAEPEPEPEPAPEKPKKKTKKSA